MHSKLKDMTFIEGLGTMEDKVKRITCLVAKIAPKASRLDAIIAAQHCKDDLVTKIVQEYPDLQGTIGGWMIENGYLAKDFLGNEEDENG